MRALLLLLTLALPGLAAAESVSLYTSDPAECGTYAEGTLSDDGFFPGGEAGSLALVDPLPISTAPDATLYEGAAVNEGNPVRIGPVIVIREYGADGVEVVRVFTGSEPMQERRVCPG
ncbi:hypothetical protein [Jannaschia marina]|uniref:hypothetical protein n=1 Tax=Jannaschia marina TaxID=2741674 RepID=UPI0015CB1107|nr:hypothetical protein [Jannaschia marina]